MVVVSDLCTVEEVGSPSHGEVARTSSPNGEEGVPGRNRALAHREEHDVQVVVHVCNHSLGPVPVVLYPEKEEGGILSDIPGRSLHEGNNL